MNVLSDQNVNAVSATAKEVTFDPLSPSTDVNNTIAEELMSKMDVSGHLTSEQLSKVKEVIGKHVSTFNRGDDDKGFCDKVSHRIQLNDDIPFLVPH